MKTSHFTSSDFDKLQDLVVQAIHWQIFALDTRDEGHQVEYTLKVKWLGVWIPVIKMVTLKNPA